MEDSAKTGVFESPPMVAIRADLRRLRKALTGLQMQTGALASRSADVSVNECFGALARMEQHAGCGSYIPEVGAPAVRFEKTYCSQCGGDQGPGDNGVSRCEDHRPGWPGRKSA